MASATIESSLGDHDISPAAMILRNNDPLSQTLRGGSTFDVTEIARLDRTFLSSHDMLSSVASSSTKAFSSRGESSDTKPTSAGTIHPTNTNQNKRKHRLKTDDTSSLSVTYGSASEAEVRRKVLRRNNLIAVGDWAEAELEHTRPLKGMARAKDRQQSRRKQKQKKPIIVLEQEGSAQPAARGHGQFEERRLLLMTAPSYGSTVDKRLPPCSPIQGSEPTRLAEEGHSSANTAHCTESKSLSRTRLYTLVGIAITKVLIIAITTYFAYLTGRTNLPCTKGIVFAATAFMTMLTFSAMLVAMRAVSEALLAGLVEFVFGFAFIAELDDFM